MSAKKHVKSKMAQVKDPKPELDFLELFHKHKKTIIFSTTLVLVVVIICIFYNIYTTNLENESWHFYSKFLQEKADFQSITQTDIRELLEVTKNTAAEPWARYYCIFIYFNKNDLDNASKMLDELEHDFKDHYLLMNDAFLQNIRDLISREKQWMSSIAKQ